MYVLLICLSGTTPYSQGGPTHAGNLKCYCRTHHRLETFHGGWCDRQLADGTVTRLGYTLARQVHGIHGKRRCVGGTSPTPFEEYVAVISTTLLAWMVAMVGS
jgi:hypothetical protein